MLTPRAQDIEQTQVMVGVKLQVCVGQEADGSSAAGDEQLDSGNEEIQGRKPLSKLNR